MNSNEMFYSESETDVLLIQPPILKHLAEPDIDPVQLNYWDSMGKVGRLLGDLPIEPNCGLMYLGASLKKNNYSVQMVDFHLFDYLKYENTGDFCSPKDITSILSRKHAKVIGITSVTRSHNRALKIAHVCKLLYPNSIIVLGGIHFSYVYEEVLKEHPYVDAIMRGESEESIIDMMKVYNNKDEWHSVPGIAYIDKEGNLKDDSDPVVLKDIDNIPLPDYSLWPKDIPLIPRVYLSRGCIGKCDYCVVNNFFKCTYRKRDIDKAINEIEHLYENYNIDQILIGDLCFPAFRDHTIEFCKKIIDRGIKVKWWAQTRPDKVDDELLEYMKAAGCVQIAIGIESSNEEVLKTINSEKVVDNNKLNLFDTCKLIKKYGILVQGYFIFGLPNESMEDSVKTIRLMDEMFNMDLLDLTHLSVMVPYPGTSLLMNPSSFSIEIIEKDYDSYLMNCDLMNAGVPVYNTDKLDSFQIYSIWQLALSTAAKHYKIKSKTAGPQVFNSLEDGINEFKETLNEYASESSISIDFALNSQDCIMNHINGTVDCDYKDVFIND